MSKQQDIPMREIPIETADDEKNPAKPVGRYYCALREQPAPSFDANVIIERQRLILVWRNKWVNGTVLRYYFFDRNTDGENIKLPDGTTQWRSWVGAEKQQAVVRRGFEAWQDLGIGISFQEVDEREEAEIRIGFMRGDGAWSALGRGVLDRGPNERTMNFGWDLTLPGELDTAIHEIGHTLGFPHEHQNPKSGIAWDEAAVYAALAQPPNSWDQQTTYWNILRKLSLNEVEGTAWDPNSVMHYPFPAGLIKKPEQYANGLQPAGGLSAKDQSWARAVYPPIPDEVKDELKPSQSVLLKLTAGEQRNFIVVPQETRYYEFQTFGTSDSVMVLFEDDSGHLRYRTGDDDSGQDANAYFRIKLIKERTYVLRVRMYYSDRPGQTAIMMW